MSLTGTLATAGAEENEANSLVRKREDEEDGTKEAVPTTAAAGAEVNEGNSLVRKREDEEDGSKEAVPTAAAAPEPVKKKAKATPKTDAVPKAKAAPKVPKVPKVEEVPVVEPPPQHCYICASKSGLSPFYDVRWCSACRDDFVGGNFNRIRVMKFFGFSKAAATDIHHSVSGNLNHILIYNRQTVDRAFCLKHQQKPKNMSLRVLLGKKGFADK